MTKQNWIFGLIVLIHGFILTRLIYFPYPELFVYPYLLNQGLLPYGQILDQHFPGLMFLPINLNNLGMLNEQIARVWSIGIVVLIQLLLYIIGQKILASKTKALLVCLVYLFWQPFFEGYVLWIDSFLPLMLLPAFYFSYQAIMTKQLRPIWLAGLFLGLGVVFKQVVIPLAGVVFILIWWYRRNWQTVWQFVAGFLPLPLLMVAYYWSMGVLKDFWFWTVTFNLTTFAEQGKKPPFFSGVVRLLGVYAPAVGLVLAERKLALMLGVYIVAGLAAIYARFDFVHLQPTLPFVALATVLVIDRVVKLGWGKLAIVGYCLMLVWWQAIFYRGHLGETVLFFDPQTKLVAEKIKQYTQPGEEIFLFGPVLHLYYLSETIPAGRVFVFQFPWFFHDAGDRVLAGVKTNPKLILRDRTVEIEGQKITNFGAEIDQYIDQNYEVFEVIGNTEFMRPKNKAVVNG